ncbi:efflux RND transporter periplasmic adaptor subunit [Flavobacterium urocaniciphilum]|uniref:Membrane fusion protein, cobalt-zinc-cadmium efflux system n=1 Tax=Flavobacterium urocaniciphilum TaxID=1299341 RepID=A0A1H9E233_9FLAO|nr:efflux RND transporter periplasmic adaptor subunit [Flavobacterium urocaniciphilum]SEQ19725.1 membrane fusion protein, cobalt-zinc-cadmium efflux system [Flavobacterium urocaniciphilum]
MKFIYRILILFFVLGCNSKTETTPFGKNTDENHVELTKTQLKNADLNFGTIQQQAMNSVIKVNGKITLSPDAVASISMPLGGYIKSIKVMPGMQVSKGQVLAIIEDQSYVQLQQDYLNTKQQLNFTAKDYQRQKELNASQASSDKTYQLAESEFSKNKITLKALDEKLRLININPLSLTENTISKSVRIIAPISGMLTKVNVNLGKYVNATDVLFQIMDSKNMFAQLQVFDKDAGSLSIGQKLKVYTNAQPDVMYSTSIQYVNKSFDERENTVEVYAKIDNYTRKLIPGNYVNAIIELTNENAFAVNHDAVVTFEGENYVFIQESNTAFQMVKVQTGIISKDYTEIRNYEVLQNRKVVTKNAYTLLMVLKNKEE